MNKKIAQPKNSANTSKTSAVAQLELEFTNSEAYTDSASAQPSQQQQAIPDKATTAFEWHKLVGAARLMWSKLSEVELLTSKGDEQKLTEIVSSRYVISHNIANVQVKKFLAIQMIAECFKPMDRAVVLV